MRDDNLDKDQEKDSDADLRRAINSKSTTTSELHDQTILEAAKAMSLSKPKKPWWPTAIAAALVISVLGVLVLQLNPPAVENTVRGIDRESVVPAPGVILNKAPDVFHWRQSDQSQHSCQIELRDGQADIIWTSRWQSDTAIYLPANAQNLLDNETKYTWIARCRDTGASVFGPYVFTLEIN